MRANARALRFSQQPQLWLLIAFVGSRVAFYLAGVRFDLSPLDGSWQILDPVLLRQDLLRSVSFTPGQPPLYNLMLGAVLKLSHDAWILAAVFRVLYGGMAFGTTLLLHDILRQLAIGPVWSLALSLGFMLSPALVLYESLPYYTLPVLLLLTASVWLFQRLHRQFTQAGAVALFVTMALLIYVRAMFQVYWLLALLAFCCWVFPPRRRALLRAAAVPLVLVAALYAKNAAVTGHAATSSWLGMSMVKLSVRPLPLALRQRLVAEGKMSHLALSDHTYRPPEHYAAFFQTTPRTGVAVLDRPYKSTGGVNYHHLAYARVSAQALEDALYGAWHYPGHYLRSVGKAFVLFFRPASDYPFLQANRAAIEPWSRWYARLVAGQPSYPRAPGFALERGQVGYLLVAAHVLCVLGGGLVFSRALLLRRLSAREAVLVLMWLNVLYVSLVGNALEIGENQRFRCYLHPLILASLAGLAQEGWARREAKKGPAPPEPSGARWPRPTLP